MLVQFFSHFFASTLAFSLLTSCVRQSWFLPAVVSSSCWMLVKLPGISFQQPGFHLSQHRRSSL